jgi:hypothetical protein
MALAKYTLTNGFWKKISTAGQSGTAWIKDFNGAHPIILISHTISAQTYNPNDDPDLGILSDNIPYASAVGLDVNIAYELPVTDNQISVPFSPDTEADVYYATILNTGKTADIIADFI